MASRAPCSQSPLSCGSGECLPGERHCDPQPDCQDGWGEDSWGVYVAKRGEPL
ncbi:hypothetical protein MC885_001648 [Smutsia gigantea]|nr:hypothetical protein MC885_001648 [Smutsia gigantea]